MHVAHTRGGTVLHCQGCDRWLVWDAFCQLWSWRRWVTHRQLNRKWGLRWRDGWRRFVREIRLYRQHGHFTPPRGR